jgi:hypothetical protein
VVSPVSSSGVGDKAVQRARDRIRELTCRSRLLLDPKWVVQDLNRFLGGWAAYFRFGNSAARFGKIRRYALMRLTLFISKRNRRSREFGWQVVAFQSPDQLGLTALSGIVVDPRPFRDWWGRPNAGGERRRRAVCGKTARTVRGGGDWKRHRPGQGHWGGTTDRETGGQEGLRP